MFVVNKVVGWCFLDKVFVLFILMIICDWWIDFNCDLVLILDIKLFYVWY